MEHFGALSSDLWSDDTAGDAPAPAVGRAPRRMAAPHLGPPSDEALGARDQLLSVWAEPDTHHAPVSRDELRLLVGATMGLEIEQLDQAFTKESKHLDEACAAQLAELDREKSRQTTAMTARRRDGEAALDETIDERRGVHAGAIGRAGDYLGGVIEKHAEPLAEQADAGSLRARAEQQAGTLLAKARAEADHIMAAAEAEARTTIADGEAMGVRARKAAYAQAVRVPVEAAGAEQEKEAILAAAEPRIKSSLDEAEQRAEGLRRHAAERAEMLMQHAQRDAAAIVARGEQAAAEARARVDAASARMEGAREDARAGMMGISNEAVARMKAAAGDGALAGLVSAGFAGDAMDGTRGEAAKAVEAARAEALQALQRKHDDQKQRIEARGAAELAKIDAGGDRDLEHLGRQIDRDLTGMARMAEDAGGRMAGDVASVQKRLAPRIQRDRAAMRAQAAKALREIDRYLAEARKKIAQADQGTFAALADAARAGVAAIADSGFEGLEAGKAAEAAAAKDLVDFVSAQETGIANEGKEDVAALSSERTAAGAAMNDRLAAEALATIGGDLTREHALSWISDGEATHALDTLASLPAGARGQAVAGLSADQLTNLLSEVPNARREDFLALLDDMEGGWDKLRLQMAYDEAHPDEVQVGVDVTAFAAGEGDKGEIDLNDVKQGSIGDCYLMSSMGAMALQNPALIRRMITENKDLDGNVISYTVTFKKPDKTGEVVDFPVTVDAHHFPRGGHSAQASGDKDARGQLEIWPLIIEKAYAKMNGGYFMIGNGGRPEDTMETMTGVESETHSAGNYEFEELQRDLAAGKGITVSTGKLWDRMKNMIVDVELDHDLVIRHIYTVTAARIDGAGKKVIDLNNPWGRRHATVPFDDLEDNGIKFQVNEGIAPGGA